MQKLIEIIKGLTSAKFYGKLIIRFEAGNVVLLTKEENLKV